MTGIKRLIIYAMFCRTLALGAQSPGELAWKVDQISPFIANASYDVFLPQAADPVHYEVNLLSYIPAEPDSLAPCNYLLRWRLYAPGQQVSADAVPRSEGFSAYFSGHHYRYSAGQRLQEYHASQNPKAFTPTDGSVDKGVQCTVQFADLLPQFIARWLKNAEADTAFQSTCTMRGNDVAVRGVQRARGFDWLEYNYTFNSTRAMQPMSIVTITAPGAISEQTVEVKYSYGDNPSIDYNLIPLTEEKLISLFPDVFSTMRQSSFRIENMREQPLPRFTAPDFSGRHIEYNAGQGFGSPAVIAFIDPQVGDAAAIVRDVRSAVSTLPFGASIVWAVMSNHNDTVVQLLGPGEVAGETLLRNPRNLARDCGVTDFPTLIFCNLQGIVKEVQVGVNNDMVSLVIQKTMLAR